MDLQMPDMNGIDAIIAIRGEFPDARIIVLTTYSGRRPGAACASGRRSGIPAEECRCIRSFSTRSARSTPEKRCCRRDLLQNCRTRHGRRPDQSEIDVLRLIAEGKANKQIADQLSITEDTVKGRVKNILSKLGADDRTHAAMIGLKRGIIELLST